MADTKFANPDALDNDALLKQLGGAAGGVSNTMPVSAPVPFAGEEAAATAPAQLPAATAPAPRRGTWGNLNLDAPEQRGINQFSGFNAERALAGTDTDSVKDAFQRWAGGQDFDLRGKTKEQIGDFYKSQLQNAKDYGLDIRDVQGEKILINTKERGPEWIDSVIGAGGDNPMFGWQSEYDNVGNAALAPNAPSLGDSALANVISGGGGEKTAQQKIQDEINALIQGGGSPIDEDALLEQLQV